MLNFRYLVRPFINALYFHQLKAVRTIVDDKWTNVPDSDVAIKYYLHSHFDLISPDIMPRSIIVWQQDKSASYTSLAITDDMGMVRICLPMQSTTSKSMARLILCGQSRLKRTSFGSMHATKRLIIIPQHIRLYGVVVLSPISKGYNPLRNEFILYFN